MDQRHMREFWNRRAREEPYFFVDDRRAYGDPELESFWAEGERDLGRLLELLEIRIEPSDTVLDIGCGVGRLTRVLAGRAAHVYGIDISSEMIDHARGHHAALGNVEWFVGDGHSLRPLGDASVDGCISHVVFQHIPDPAVTLGYIAEMGRVLRPGGWAAFQVSNDAGIHRRRRDARTWIRGLAAALGRAPRGQGDPAWLGSAVDLDEAREIAERNGLELDRIVGKGTQFCLIRARKR
jgi:SAM-dependent methyltransferase